MFRRVFSRLHKIKPNIIMLTAPLVFYKMKTIHMVEQNAQSKLRKEKNKNYTIAIQLNQQIFLENILGNRQNFFFIIVYKEKADGGQGEGQAIKVSQYLREIINDMKQKDSRKLLYQTFLQPQLNDLSKQVNRVKGQTFLQNDNHQKDIEIYFKTPYSDDFLSLNYKPSRFFQKYKKEKLTQKLNRICNLFRIVETPMELCQFIQRNYYKLNAPLIIKSGSQRIKDQQRDLKYFKKACFHMIERKLLSIDAEFLLIQNDQLENELNLSKKDILILRNDILQKYNDCQIINNSILVPQLTLQPYKDTQSLIGFIKGKLEHFETWKVSNFKVVNKLAEEKSNYLNFLNTFQAFALPRIIYLQSNRRSDVASLLKKFHFTRDEEYYAISLQLSQNSNQENHIRLINFFKLQNEFQNEKIVFFISASNGIDDIFPHLNETNSSFVLFNLFRQINLNNKFKEPIYKRLSHSYEKYFLTDLQNPTEDYTVLRTKIKSILQTPLDQRVNQIDLISSDFDKIRRINGIALMNIIQQQSNITKIIHVYRPGLVGNFVRKTLIDLTVQHNEIEFYQVSSENQINMNIDVQIKDGIFIIHEGQITYINLGDIDKVQEKLRNTIDSIIQK